MATEPVTLAETKDWLRIDSSDDDVLLNNLIIAARYTAENYTNRKFITATCVDYFNNFQNEFVLFWGNLLTVTTLKYYDESSTQQTLAATYYDVDTSSEPAKVRIAYNQSWPTCRGHTNDVEITYTAGYGATAASVPEPLKLALFYLIAHWYENRLPVDADPKNEVPLTVKSILDTYRIYNFK